MKPQTNPISQPSTQPQSNPPPQETPAVSQYSKFFNNDFLSDCILERADPKSAASFKAHKTILAANSDFFFKYFKDPATNDPGHKVPLPKFVDPAYGFDSQDVLAKIVEFFYSNQTLQDLTKLGINKHNALSFLSLFSGLEYSKGKELVEAFVEKEVLTQNNCTDCLQVAVKLDNKALREKCINLALPIFEDILEDTKKRKILLQLPLEAFKEILGKDEIKLQNENVLLDLIVDYVQSRESLQPKEEPTPVVPAPEQGAPAKVEEKQPEKKPEAEAEKAAEKPGEEKPKEEEKKEETPKADAKPADATKPEEPKAEEKPAVTEGKPAEKAEEKKEEKKEEGEKKPEGEAKPAEKVDEKAGEKAPEEKPAENEGDKPAEKEGDKPAEAPADKPAETKLEKPALDFEAEAQERLKAHKLSQDEKRDLVKLLRLVHLSHDVLIKASGMPIFSDFKDIFIEALSAKLNAYETAETNKYSLNMSTRIYTDSPSPKKGAWGTSPNKNLNSTAPASNSGNQQPTRSSPSPNRDLQNPHSFVRHPEIFNPTYSSNRSPQQFTSPPKKQYLQQSPPGNIQSQSHFPTTVDSFYPGESIRSMPGQQRFSHENLHQSSPPRANRGYEREAEHQFSRSDPLFEPPRNIQDLAYSSAQVRTSTPMDNASFPMMASMKTSKMSPPQAGKGPIVFSYKYDLDDNGAFYYLGSYGKQAEWQNPHEIGQVQVFFSSLGRGTLADFVGREVVNCRTLNEPNSFMGVDLGVNRWLIPTCYTLRNRNSNHHVLLNWILEGSMDLKEWYWVDRRTHFSGEDAALNQSMAGTREELKEKGYLSTWGINEHQVEKIRKTFENSGRRFTGFRYFKITQVGKNSSGSYNLALGGFEIYGVAMGETWRF